MMENFVTVYQVVEIFRLATTDSAAIGGKKWALPS